MAIYDTMNLIKSDVSTICVGMSASMAAFLLSCGTKGKRYILPNAEVMIHQPLGGASGQATEIKIAAERILKLRTKLNLTQQEIADECMISQTTYSNYELGLYLINTLSLYTICKKHKLSMYDILK